MPSETMPSSAAAGWHGVACVVALLATCVSSVPLTSPQAHKYFHPQQQQQQQQQQHQLLSITAAQPLAYASVSTTHRAGSLDEPSARSLSEEELLKTLSALQALEEEGEVLAYLASLRSGSRGRQAQREVATSEAMLESLLLEALARRDQGLQTRQAEEEKQQQEEDDEDVVREVLAGQPRRIPRNGRIFSPLYSQKSRSHGLGVENGDADVDDGGEEEEEDIGGAAAAKVNDGYGDDGAVEEELEENRAARWRSGGDDEEEDDEEGEANDGGEEEEEEEAGEARDLLQLLEVLQGRDTRQSEGRGGAGQQAGEAAGEEVARSVAVMDERHRNDKAVGQRPRLLKQQRQRQQLDREDEEALGQAANLLLHFALQAGEKENSAPSRSRGPNAAPRSRSPYPGQGSRSPYPGQGSRSPYPGQAQGERPPAAKGRVEGRHRPRPAHDGDDEEEEEEEERTAELENLVKLLLLQEAEGEGRDGGAGDEDDDDANDDDGGAVEKQQQQQQQQQQQRQRGDGQSRSKASDKGVASPARTAWKETSARGRHGPKDQKRGGVMDTEGDAAAAEEIEEVEEEQGGLDRAAKSRQSAKGEEEEERGDGEGGRSEEEEERAAEEERGDNEVLHELLQNLKLDEEGRLEESQPPPPPPPPPHRLDAPRSAHDDARIVEELSKFIVDDDGGGNDEDDDDDVEDTVEVEDLEEEDDGDDDNDDDDGGDDRRKRVSPSYRQQKGHGPIVEPRLDLEGLLVELLQGAARVKGDGAGDVARYASVPPAYRERAS